MADDLQALAVGKLPGQAVRRLDQVPVHVRRKEGVSLEAHVLVEPDAVRLAGLGKQDLHQADDQVGVDLDHVLNPFRFQRHRHQDCLVAAQGAQKLKDIHRRGKEKSSRSVCLLHRLAIAFQVQTIRDRFQQGL